MKKINGSQPGGVVGGQNSEIEQVFRQNERVLIHWLTKKLGDAETAHDIAQSAFAKVWQYSKNNVVENAKALIFKTAANLALNELRRRNRFFKRNVFTNDLVEIGPLRYKPSSEPTPEETVRVQQEAKILLATIDQLSPKLRDAYIMHRFEGLTYKQIAEKLGVSVSSVEKYMIEALSTLRRVILPDAEHKRNKPSVRKTATAKPLKTRIAVTSYMRTKVSEAPND